MTESAMAAGEYAKVGGYIYARIGALTAAAPEKGTAEAAELDYLLDIATRVGANPEKAEAGDALATFPAPAQQA